MKKITKFFLCGALLVFLLTPVSQVKADWQRDNVGWWYLRTDGSYYKNVGAKINGKWYKFDERGYMITGWHLLEYFGDRGEKITSWYYFDPVNGDQKFGWQNIDGKWYYFAENMLRGSHLIDGKLYYFDLVNGDMKTGWFELNGSKYYADPDDGGALALNKTLIIDGVPYSFDDTGRLIQN